MGLFQKSQLAHVALLSSQLCFSGWHVLGSMAMKSGASPYVFVLYREIVASLIMFSALYFSGQKIKIIPSDTRRFILAGACSFVNVVGAMLALNYISATRFAIFQPSIPCIATTISILCGLENFNWLKAVGVMMAVGGAVLTECWNSASREDEKNPVLGTIIVCLQVVGMGSLVVIVKPLLYKYPPMIVTFTYYSIGTIFTTFLFAGFAYQFTLADLAFGYNMLPWLGLAYASTFATVYTYFALSWAGKQLTPSTTTVYSTFQPVGTAILSFVFMGSVVTLSEGIGGLMVALGLCMTVLGPQYFFPQFKETSSDEDWEKERGLRLLDDEEEILRLGCGGGSGSEEDAIGSGSLGSDTITISNHRPFYNQIVESLNFPPESA